MMSNVQKYSRIQIILHWAIAGLFLISFFSHEAMSHTWRSLMRTGTPELTIGTAVHVWVGVLIFALVVVRVLVRLRKGAPAEPAGHPLVKLVAKIVHFGLYAVMILLPMAGMAAWFGGVKESADNHEILFNIGMVLLALHVGGALYHQFIVKDNLLARMR